MPKTLRWRYSMGRHYLEDDKFGYAYIDKRDAGYLATVPFVGSATFRRLRGAKAYAEKHSRGWGRC
jgi:hypothetical protein